MKIKDKTDTTEYIAQIENELSKLRRLERFCEKSRSDILQVFFLG